MKTTKGCLDHILLGEDYLDEGLFGKSHQERLAKLKKCEKSSNYYRGQIESLDAAIKYGGDKPEIVKRAKEVMNVCKRCLQQRGERV